MAAQTAAQTALSPPLTHAGLLDECHAVMGVTRLESALDRLAQLRHAVLAAAVAPNSVADGIAAQLADGDDITDDEVTRRLGDAVDHAQRQDAVRSLLDVVGQSLTARLGMSHGTEVDRGLDVLRPRLAELLDVARPVVAALGSVSTPAAAIDAGVVEEWKTLDRVAGDLDALRSVQRRLVTDGSSQADRGRVVDLFGHVEDADAHVDLRAVTEAMQGGPRRAHQLTGSAVERPRVPWFDGTPAERLRYLCGQNVQPWLPSVPELLAAERDAHDAHAARVAQAAQLADQAQRGQDEAPGAYGRRVLRPSSLMS